MPRPLAAEFLKFRKSSRPRRRHRTNRRIPPCDGQPVDADGQHGFRAIGLVFLRAVKKAIEIRTGGHVGRQLFAKAKRIIERHALGEHEGAVILWQTIADQRGTDDGRVYDLDHQGASAVGCAGRDHGPPVNPRQRSDQDCPALIFLGGEMALADKRLHAGSNQVAHLLRHAGEVEFFNIIVRYRDADIAAPNITRRHGDPRQRIGA